MRKLISQVRAWAWIAGALAIAVLTLSFASVSGGVYDKRGREILRLGGSVDEVLSDRHSGVLLLGSFFGQGRGIVRLRGNGSFDRSFGRDGFVEVEWRDALVRADGSILAIGSTSEFGASDVIVTCLRRDGRKAKSFGRNGVATVPFGGEFDHGTAVALGPQGKIWIGGSGATMESQRGDTDAVAVVGRLQANGALDRSFGKNGLKTLGEAGEVGALSGDRNGRVLVSLGRNAELGITRLLRGGAIDSTFADRGHLSVRAPSDPIFEGYFAPVNHIGVLPDGGFVLVGTAAKTSSPVTFGAMVLRMDEAGTPVASFGSGGYATADFSGETFTEGFTVRRDGSVFVAAITSAKAPGGDWRGLVGIVALRPDGRPDPAFGRDGRLAVGFPGSASARDLAFQSPTRLIAAGLLQAASRRNRTAVVRVPVHPPRVR